MPRDQAGQDGSVDEKGTAMKYPGHLEKADIRAGTQQEALIRILSLAAGLSSCTTTLTNDYDWLLEVQL
ncbi:hypothetical protein H8959_002523 [Pygathrix nigripes]